MYVYMEIITATGEKQASIFHQQRESQFYTKHVFNALTCGLCTLTCVTDADFFTIAQM